VASPSSAYADTLRIGWNPGINGSDIPFAWFGFRDATSALVPSQITVGGAIFSGLYRYDATWGAVPDLADGPCLPQGDGRVIRCRLIATTFHDGTPLTADDVAFTYQLEQRSTFTGLWAGVGSLEEVRVVDPRTVDFVLTSVDPTFLTTVLPGTPILPRHIVEAAYAALAARAGGLKVADLTKLADAIDEEVNRDPPVCGPRVEPVTALLAKVGVRVYREDFSRGGTFDACAYLVAASSLIRDGLAVTLGSTGLDAVAAAYSSLSLSWQPIGTGPYRFVSEDANGIHLEAWPGYHGGVAATRHLDFVPAKGDGSDVVDGAVHIYQANAFTESVRLGAAFRATAASHGVSLATMRQTGFYALMFNVRPGRLFADLNLRKALQLCIDLPRDVDAATGGNGTAVYGPVTPGTWAYDPALPKPARDVATARKLIEAAGWRLGADGIFAKGGIRLAAAIPAKGTDPLRVKMADLIASQGRDCGMDLHGQPTSVPDIYNTLLQYPHDLPGTHTPFDLFIGAWSGSPDPGTLDEFVSTNITDAQHPDGTSTFQDFTGFSDPTLDHAVKAAMATYDQAARASLYRQVQQELAAQLPYVFLWAANGFDVVRSTVTTSDGPLDLAAPNWAWQPERLVVAKSGT
jgi:ABC-type transport system substrate-binding protein